MQTGGFGVLGLCFHGVDGIDVDGAGFVRDVLINGGRLRFDVMSYRPLFQFVPLDSASVTCSNASSLVGADEVQGELNGLKCWLVDDAGRKLRRATPKKVGRWFSSPDQTFLSSLLGEPLC